MRRSLTFQHRVSSVSFIPVLHSVIFWSPFILTGTTEVRSEEPKKLTRFPTVAAGHRGEQFCVEINASQPNTAAWRDRPLLSNQPELATNLRNLPAVLLDEVTKLSHGMSPGRLTLTEREQMARLHAESFYFPAQFCRSSSGERGLGHKHLSRQFLLLSFTHDEAHRSHVVFSPREDVHWALWSGEKRTFDH